MPYVHRDAMGRIESIHKTATPAAVEYLDASDAELRSFLAQIDPSAPFASLDAEVVRVLEDVVDAILAKGLIDLSDLPPDAQAKLVERKERRAAEQEARMQTFSASGFVEIIDDSAFGQLADVVKTPPR